MPPMVTDVTLSPPLLNVNDRANLTCMGLGGPRLVLTWWSEDGSIVATGTRGTDVLVYNFTADKDKFGKYTCTATIDDMQMTGSLFVVGECQH